MQLTTIYVTPADIASYQHHRSTSGQWNPFSFTQFYQPTQPASKRASESERVQTSPTTTMSRPGRVIETTTAQLTGRPPGGYSWPGSGDAEGINTERIEWKHEGRYDHMYRLVDPTFLAKLACRKCNMAVAATADVAVVNPYLLRTPSIVSPNSQDVTSLICPERGRRHVAFLNLAS